VTGRATSRPLRDLALAITMLTIVPLRAMWPEEESPDVAGYFPAAGVLLGVFGYALAYGPVVIGVPFSSGSVPHSLLLAALLVTGWGLLTRLLHWDGLADVADAFWGSHEPARRLEIMSDPHTGAFAAAAVTLVGMVQVTAVSVLIGEGALLAIAAAPVLGRFGAVFGSWFGVSVKQSGLGAAVTRRPRAASALFAIAVLGVVALLCANAGVWPMVGVLASVVIALGVPHLLASRFGGITGDVLGASVLLTETAALIVFALVW
jgi:adenosylcobinamide-GDP ribazoletransferase